MALTEDAVEAPRIVGAGRTLGTRLKAAREALGLTVADISNRTRIPQRQLAALEADAHEVLPGLIFAIGFVKSFAREVGLDAEEAAQQFRAETTRPAYTPPVSSYEAIEPERVPSRRLAWVSALVVAAALVGVVLWYQGSEPEQTAATPAAGEVALDQQASVDQPLAATPAPIAGPDGAPTVLAGAAVPAAAPPAPAMPVGGTGVTLTARQDVWIQISDRSTGQKINSQVLRQGDTYAVPPGDLTLWTGRAGALDVRVGGRPVPPLGGDAETIRDLSLSAGSLLGRAAAAAPIPQLRPAAGPLPR